ncbi:protein SLX4IP [Spea bombifrons]|uniref:protein SLX4IP n=1 Tax=Spea bombifrons TaxID=233779 RepID=UPI00234B509A|nr:protein SLX4IP [Spea bombifrons]
MSVSALFVIMSNKLAIKCGNFAVLVDLHVLPQGTSKDTSWFSDQEKEEVCKLLKDTVDARVRQHIETRRQQGQVKHKEYSQSSPLFLKGDRFRIAAYFIKRWVNLRCVVKQRYRELHVFPERFVVCASQLELDPNTLEVDIDKTTGMIESSSRGTSEYFAECRGNQISNMLSAPMQQAVLKNIVKKAKSTRIASCEAETSTDRKVFPCLRPTDSDKGSKGKKDQALANSESEAKCGSLEQPKDCINTTENSLELPVPEVENHVNCRQPCEASSQQKTQSVEWLKAQDLTKALSWICESVVPEQKQHFRTSVMQQKRRRHSSEGKTNTSKKADLRDDTFLLHDLHTRNSYTGEVETSENIPLNTKLNSSIGTSDSLTTGTNIQPIQCRTDHVQPEAVLCGAKKLKLQRTKKVQ